MVTGCGGQQAGKRHEKTVSLAGRVKENAGRRLPGRARPLGVLMSLFKQLLIAICLFLVIAFSGSFLVSLESSRAQYVNQLRSHAQDAATALALTLTPNIDDPAMVELLVSSIFDS